MGYLKKYTNDVFISFTHKDNLDSGAEQGNGWVSQLHLGLQKRLTQVLGANVNVWRDSKLRGTDVFDDEIFEQLRRSAILLSVVSPGYQGSIYCQNELEEFQKCAAKTGGLQFGSFFRIVTAVKTPMDGDQHRELYRKALGHEFYDREPMSNYFNEFAPESEAYKNRLDHLAQDIAEGLKTMEKKGGTTQVSKTAVYVAETTSDLKGERQILVDELIAQGYQVFPLHPLPDTVEDIHSELEPLFRQAVVTVHLTGHRYGKRPEGTDQSIIALQYQLAREHRIPCIVWICKKADEVESPQSDFLAHLREDMEGGLDLLEQKTIEDLKDVVLARLKPNSPELGLTTEPGPLVRIYLICDQKDHPINCEENSQSQTLAIRDYLFDAGFEVKLPPAMATATVSLQKDNREKLKLCDAVLLYWGRAPETWVEERLTELNKALGWRRARPFSAKAIYVTVPEDAAKHIYRTREARLIPHFGGFVPECLAPFLAELDSAQKAG